MFDREMLDGRSVYDRIEYKRKRRCKGYEIYFMGHCDNIKRMY